MIETVESETNMGLRRRSSRAIGTRKPAKAALVSAAAFMVFAMGTGRLAAQSSDDAVAREFPNQNFPENLPDRALAGNYPGEWKA